VDEGRMRVQVRALAKRRRRSQPSLRRRRRQDGSAKNRGAPETIRTSDPCLRRAVLYPTELRAQGGRIVAARALDVMAERQASRDAKRPVRAVLSRVLEIRIILI